MAMFCAKRAIFRMFCRVCVTSRQVMMESQIWAQDAVETSNRRRRMMTWRRFADSRKARRNQRASKQHQKWLLRDAIESWRSGARVSALTREVDLHKERLRAKVGQWLHEIDEVGGVAA